MQSQYYRTFIAVPVSAGNGFLEARSELMKLLKDERISWVNPENYHVTIRFLGEIIVSRTDVISASLEKHINNTQKMVINFNKPGSFGPLKKPRVIWVGFEQVSFFESLKLNVDMALESCGFPKTNQPFRAHLTLGRVRNKLRDRDGYYRAIKSMAYRFRDQACMDKLVFYRSEAGPDGPVYTPLFKKDFLPG